MNEGNTEYIDFHLLNKKQKEDAQKALIQRISDARDDRGHWANRINHAIELTQPNSQRVQRELGKTAREVEVDADIFDVTLQDMHEDFASDMADLFTPSYRNWTGFEPSVGLNEDDMAIVEEAMEGYADKVFEGIRASNFHSNAHQLFLDVGYSAGGMNVPLSAPGEPIVVEPVPIASLLFDYGHDGLVDGRWREMHVKVRHLELKWPNVQSKELSDIIQKHKNAKTLNKAVHVTEGYHRDWSAIDNEYWIWSLVVEKKLVAQERYAGPGSCGLHVGRWAVTYPSAWGPGVVMSALPAARYCNQVEYTKLGAINKAVDPAVLYDEDGLINLEGGINSGEAIPRMPGSKIDFLLPDSRFDILAYDMEEKRYSIKRKLFQDKPFQRGDTPPSATQWIDERASNNRRIGSPRSRLYTEFVLPMIQRFIHIMSSNGELDNIKIDSRIINVKAISPLSKASDAEDVSVANQLLSSAGATLGEQMPLVVDTHKTLENMKRKLDDSIVELRPQEESAQLIAAQLAAGAPNAL